MRILNEWQTSLERHDQVACAVPVYRDDARYTHECAAHLFVNATMLYIVLGFTRYVHVLGSPPWLARPLVRDAFFAFLFSSLVSYLLYVLPPSPALPPWSDIRGVGAPGRREHYMKPSALYAGVESPPRPHCNAGVPGKEPSGIVGR